MFASVSQPSLSSSSYTLLQPLDEVELAIFESKMASYSDHDVVSTPDLDDLLEKHGLEVGADQHLCWSADSRYHPRNWHSNRKLYDAGLIIMLEMLISSCVDSRLTIDENGRTLMSTVGSAVSDEARLEYGYEKTLGYFAFTSAFLLGEGIGGIFLPPISESFGRKLVYVAAPLLCSVFCVLVAAVPPQMNGSVACLIFARFAAGMVSSVPATVAPGSLEDMFDEKQRIWTVAAWTTASNVGVLFGPIYGSYITRYLGWRWVFWISAVIMAVCFVLTLFLRESRSTRLLQQKLDEILALTKTSSAGAAPLRIHNPDAVPSLNAFLTDTLFRPLHLLFTEPIVILCSALNAISFAMIYGLTEGLTIVYSSPSYGLADAHTTSSLAFLPLILGLFFSLPFRAVDARRFRELNADGVPPERKLTSFAVAVPALALGFWVFAWTIPPLVPQAPMWVSMAALVPVGFAINDLDSVLCGYMADVYSMYAASAFSALSLLRALCAAAFPLFAEPMFERMGANAAASVLAAIATVFCVSPWVLLRYGPALRQRSAFAEYSAAMSEKTMAGGAGAGASAGSSTETLGVAGGVDQMAMVRV
ncbi:mfs multidrug transporter [Diplodia corticola]|uniref:Mfs multidrug transporter n=1 Tax=Diplodia corticola TaxID=236234 RepID=A0A1J9R722_9PEZI|nr:mfs multidrug transporter [Diplodia corticola]OJD36400.1 mfs multidrug transporter [Diplodia corticola]